MYLSTVSKLFLHFCFSVKLSLNLLVINNCFLFQIPEVLQVVSAHVEFTLVSLILQRIVYMYLDH